MYSINDIFCEEADVLAWYFESSTEESKQYLMDKLVNPIINVLNKRDSCKKYIEYGSAFLEANAEMLSKEYPTKPVKFPRKYVDEIFDLFGFTKASLDEILVNVLKDINGSEFRTFRATPTNFIHTIALFYSDATLDRLLRDSAKQQIGLTMYNTTFNHFFHSPIHEPTMGYTYSQLNGTWNLVKCENVMNWIGDTVETAFAFYRNKLSTNLNITTISKFLVRLRNAFSQNMKLLAHKYFPNQTNGNLIGKDTTSDDEQYIEGKGVVSFRNNIMRLIKGGDSLYSDKGRLYQGIASRKNVKLDALYEYSRKVEMSDVSTIIDMILYVFCTRDGNSIDDINSAKYIGRITNLPTAVDRAVSGRPIIVPFSLKYKTDDSIVKAHICLVATFMMMRANDANK